jgi:hypothetical protein
VERGGQLAEAVCKLMLSDKPVAHMYKRCYSFMHKFVKHQTVGTRDSDKVKVATQARTNYRSNFFFQGDI